MRRSLVLGAALILTLSLSACDEDNNTKSDTIHVESVSVASIHELEVGETFTVGTNTVTVLPDNATDKSYSLSSGDTDVFTTSGYVITAVGEGSATLTVTTTDGGFTDWTTITVKGDTETEPGPEQGGGTGGDDNPNTGGEGGGTEPGPELTTLGLTINKAAYNLEVGGSEALDFTVTPEGAEYTLVTSSTNSGVADITYDTGVYTIHALSAGSTTISITAIGDSETYNDSTTESINVTVTEPDVYTYVFSIDNKAEAPTDWEYKDVNENKSFTVVPKLTEYKNGVASGETETLQANEVTLEATNVEDTASDIVTIDGLTISPSGVGVVTITATYTGEKAGVITYEDSFTLTVSESYDTTYSLKLTQGDNTEIQVGSGSFTIEVYEVVTVTALSTGEVDESQSTSTVANDMDLDFSYTDGYFSITGFTVTPTAVIEEAVDTTITITWISHPEATCVVNVHLIPKEGATYALEITDVAALQETWYTNDEAREITVSVTKTEDGATTPVNADEYQNNLVVDTYPAEQSVIEINGLTITPVGAGSVYLTVHWTDHEEARASVLITVGEHTYGLKITNATELEAEPWSIEDGEKTLDIELTSDRNDIEKTASSDNVTLTYDSTYIGEGSSYFALKPLAVTEATTITASWTITDDGDKVVSDSITVSTDNNIKVTDISLEPSSIELEAPDSKTITATLTGKDGATPTNQGVTWSITGDSTITLSATTGSSVTVTASAYNASATITAVSDDNPNAKATCTVNVSAQPAVEAKLTQEAVTPTTVASPDNRGVYVIGTETGNEYITYSNSEFSTTTSYDDAVAIRTIPAGETGQYYLAVGEYYIDSSLTVTDTDPTIVFTINASGISLDGSQIYINSGLSTSGSSAAHLIDMTLVESTTKVSSGEYYLYGVHTNYNPAFFVGSTSSSKLSTTDDISQAVKVTIENLGGNEYYMKYGSYYISVDASDTNVTYSTTAAKIYYDSTNDVWQDSTGVRYLGTNTSSGSVIFGSYTYATAGGLNNSYHAVGLYDSDPLPGIKGVGISTEEYSVGISSTIHMYGSVYPSCLTTESVSWSSSNTDYATVDSSGIVTGISATEGVTITAIDGSYSDSVSISVEDIIPDYMTSETIDFTGDMSAYGWTVSSGSQTEIPSETHFQLFTFSQVSSSTKNSLWSESLRIYSGGTITITPTAYQIEKIEFTFTNANHSWASDDTITNGTASGYGAASITVTPTDTSKAVSIYNNGTRWSSDTSDTAQRRITKMVVYYINELLVVS